VDNITPVQNPYLQLFHYLALDVLLLLIAQLINRLPVQIRKQDIILGFINTDLLLTLQLLLLEVVPRLVCQTLYKYLVLCLVMIVC